ncbi:MAG: helix-turn-helix domain-containing protein [Candidatus Diapherotrites archaeon]
MEELIELAKKLGLNEYESKAYVALSKLGSAPVSQVSRHGAIPRARVYDVLASLDSKGFAVKKPTKPVEYAALPPSAALKNLHERKRQELDSSLKELEKVCIMLERKASSGVKPGVNEGGAWSLQGGRRNIYEKILQELANAEQAVLFCTTPKGIKRKNGAFGHKLEALSKKGVKVSFAKHPNARFVVFDKSSAVLFLDPDRGSGDEERALLIKSPYIAGYLCSTLKKQG